MDFEYTITADTSGLEEGAERANREFGAMGSEAERASRSVDGAMQNMAFSAGGTANAVQGAVQTMINAWDRHVAQTQVGQTVSANYNKTLELFGPTLKAMGQSLGFVEMGIGGMTKAAWKFALTPIGAVITAIVVGLKALKTYLEGTTEGEQRLAYAAGLVTGAFGQVKEYVIAVGELIYDVFVNHDLAGAVSKFAGRVKEIVVDAKKNIVASAEASMAEKAFELEEHKLQMELTVLRSQADEARAKMYDTTLDKKAKAEAVKIYEARLKEMEAKEIDFYERRRENIEKANNTGSNDTAADSKYLDAMAKEAEVRSKYAQMRRQESQMNQMQNRWEAQSINGLTKSLEEMMKMRKEVEEKMSETARKNAKYRIEKIEDEIERRKKLIAFEAEEAELKYNLETNELKKKSKEAGVEWTPKMEEAREEGLKNLQESYAAKENSVEKEEADRQRKKNHDMIKLYGDYYQQRKVLIEEANEEMEEQIKDQSEEAKKAAREAFHKSIGEMNFAELTKNMNLDDLVDGAEDIGAETAQAIISTLQREMQEVDVFDVVEDGDTKTVKKNRYDDESIKKMQETIDAITEKTAAKNPFSALSAAYTDYEASQEAFVKAQEDMKKLMDEYLPMVEEYNKLKQEEAEIEAMAEGTEKQEAMTELMGKMLKQKQDMAKVEGRIIKQQATVAKTAKNMDRDYKKYTKTLNAAKDVVVGFAKQGEDLAAVFSQKVSQGIEKGIKTFDTLWDTTQTIISGINKLTNKVADETVAVVLTSATAMQATSTTAAESIKTVERASVILAIIGAVISAATAIANLFTNNEAHEERAEKLAKQVSEIEWKLQNFDTQRMLDQVGTPLQIMKRGFDELTASVRRNAEANAITGKVYAIRAKQTQTEAKLVKDLASAYAHASYTADKAIGESKYEQLGAKADLLAEKIVTLDKQIKEDQTQSKKDQDKDKQSDWEKEMAETAAELNKMYNDMIEDIFGGSYEDIAKQLGNAFFDACEAGEDAMAAWAKKSKEIVREAMKQMLITKFIEGPIAQIMERYKDIWVDSDNKMNLDAMRATLPNLMEEMAAQGEVGVQLMEEMKKYNDQLGFFGDSIREGASGGIAQASQDSVDELNGRMTVIQAHTFEISQGMKTLTDTAGQTLAHVANIDETTSEMKESIDAMAADARRIYGKVDDMERGGVRIKS